MYFQGVVIINVASLAQLFSNSLPRLGRGLSICRVARSVYIIFAQFFSDENFVKTPGLRRQQSSIKFWFS